MGYRFNLWTYGFIGTVEPRPFRTLVALLRHRSATDTEALVDSIREALED